MNRPPPVLLSMMGIGLHLMVLVGLPLVLARFCLRVSESNSVLATSGVLGLIVGLFLGISLGLLLIGAGIKTFRMLWYRRWWMGLAVSSAPWNAICEFDLGLDGLVLGYIFRGEAVS